MGSSGAASRLEDFIATDLVADRHLKMVPFCRIHREQPRRTLFCSALHGSACARAKSAAWSAHSPSASGEPRGT